MAPTPKTDVMMSDVDTVEGPPAAGLKDCAYLIVGDPVQTHLNSDYQQTVIVPSREMLTGQGIGAKFRRAGEVFHLEKGVSAVVFERIAPVDASDIEALQDRWRAARAKLGFDGQGAGERACAKTPGRRGAFLRPIALVQIGPIAPWGRGAWLAACAGLASQRGWIALGMGGCSSSGRQIMAYDVNDLMKQASRDFDTALNAARSALNEAPSPVMANLVRALANYSRSTTDILLTVVQKLDDVNRNVSGVAARLDGREGPFNLRMR